MPPDRVHLDGTARHLPLRETGADRICRRGSDLPHVPLRVAACIRAATAYSGAVRCFGCCAAYPLPVVGVGWVVDRVSLLNLFVRS